MNSCERGFRVWEWEGVQDLSNSSTGGIGTRRGGEGSWCVDLWLRRDRPAEEGTKLNTLKMGQT